MEISRRHGKIGNKENAEPACGSKKSKALSGASKHRPNSRQTLSKAFFAEQVVKEKKILEAAKPQPPQPHAHAKPTAGLYKGKVIQSKVGSFRTPSVIAGEGDPRPVAKPATAIVQRRRVNHATKRRSLSVTELPGHTETQKPKPKPARSNSVSDVPRQAPKRPTVAARPPTALRSTPLPPPPRASRPAAAPVSARTGAAGRGTETKVASRPAVAPVSARTGAAGRGTETKVVGEKRVSKPSLSSSLSQYRVPVESNEERRAKLADWLVSKGKAPKRPVLLARPPAKTKVPAQHHVEPESAVQREPEPEPEPEPSQDLLTIAIATAVVAGLCADQPGDSVRVEDPAGDASSPLTANATVDLMDNSDSDSDSDMDLPVDPEPGVNDIVVNLCEALSALATNEEAEARQKGGEDNCEMSSGAASEDEQNKETPEEVVDCQAEVKTGVETGSDVTSEEEEEEVDCKENEVDGKDEVKRQTQVTPTREEDASSVKFNVRTTPYLQSMRKGLLRESRSATGPRRRKPEIKELKFLTPVRRSSRIHRNSARLPALVRDHDPCVTSLAELAQLDGGGDADDADAYIYRSNPALLQDLHDPKKDLLK